jgi:hypothetical protein
MTSLSLSLQAIALLSAAGLTSGLPPKVGPDKTETWKLHSPAHDGSDRTIHVIAPAVPISHNFTQFPLIAYAHGFLGGGELDILGYSDLFHQISSYGFVVAAHASCNRGCTQPGGASRWTRCRGLPTLHPEGLGWDSYYAETLKTIDFARNGSHAPPFDLVNFSLGVGVAGHSMGGQSTAVAAGKSCTDEWDIRAAVIHHAASGVDGASGRNVGINITVPTASFTSTGDGCCEQSTYDIFASMPTAPPRLYRDVQGSSHLEPVLVPPIESPYLATFTAAWFNVFIGQAVGKAEPGSDAYEAIYGTGEGSVCGYAPMANCSVLHGRTSFVR